MVQESINGRAPGSSNVNNAPNKHKHQNKNKKQYQGNSVLQEGFSVAAYLRQAFK